MRAMIYVAAVGIASAALATPIAHAQKAEKLTPERLHADPSLDGATLRGLQISPDGARVTFLQPSLTDGESLGLWEFDLASGERRQLLSADDLLGGAEETLSPEELARRERARIRASGVVSYQWAGDGKTLLIPLSGDVFLYDVAAGRARQVTKTEGAEIDPRLSPDGSKLAFVRDQDLYVVDVATGAETRLTTDGGGAITNGASEFVAQEEMGRLQGYWWSGDGSKLAYQKTDESGVGIITRFEADEAGVRVVEQRYPRTGEANAEVSLRVIDVDGSNDRELMRFGQDAYLARVTWNGGDVIVQRQNRDQTVLELLRVDPATGAARTLLTETQEPWINLHDDLHFLSDGRFIWTSERSGERRIYLHDADGGRDETLTEGDGLVDEVLCVDEANERVFFHGRPEKEVKKRLIYSVPFDGTSRWDLISSGEGWHGASFASDCSAYVDNWSDVAVPPRVSLHGADGARRLWLEENPLDADHPFAPHAGEDLTPFTKDDGLEFITGDIKADGGARLQYRVVKPRQCSRWRKCPAIVLLYGGPHVQMVTDQWGGGRSGLFAQMLAHQGFVVFTIDNRGSYRRGLEFEGALHKAMGTVEVEDQAAGARWLARRSYVDGDRVGVYGWSYGGYMTLHMLAQRPDLFAAGVSGAPVTKWELYDTHYTERYMETPAANPEGYAQGSVFTHLGGIEDPLLLIHGMADDNVIFDNSIALIEALQEEGVLFEFMAYPGEPHGLRKRTNRVHRDKAILDFFKRRLAGD